MLATRAKWPFLAGARRRACSPAASAALASACRCSASPSTRSPSARSVSRWSRRSWPPTGSSSRAGRSASPASRKPVGSAALAITTLPAYYWLALAALGLVVARSIAALTTFRLGRALPRRARQRAAGRRGRHRSPQVPDARVRRRRRDRGRRRRTLRPLPRRAVPRGDDDRASPSTCSSSSSSAASAACAACSRRRALHRAAGGAARGAHVAPGDLRRACCSLVVIRSPGGPRERSLRRRARSA